MDPLKEFEIREAVLIDIEHLRDLECRAADLFREIPDLAHFADGKPSMNYEKQVELISQKTLWVVGDKDSTLYDGLSTPCAFLAADTVDKSLHVFELSVAPECQRRGFAKILLEVAKKYASGIGLHNLSLTTDRHVPWNGPMYAKRGFNEIDASELGPGHVEIFEKEKADGLDMNRRCTMVLPISRA